MTGEWGPLDRVVARAEALAGAWGARARASTTVGQERALLRLFGITGLDAKGRPPQDMTIQVVTPVSFTVEYSDAPITKIGVVEVHGMENCKAFSVIDNKETACTSQSAPQ